MGLRRRIGSWWTQAYSPRQRVWLAVILSFALAVRVGWVILSARRALVGDPVAYTYHATQIARGQGYRAITPAFLNHTPPELSGRYPPTAFYPIGYPAVLAAVFWIVFHTPIPDNLPKAVGFFQVVLGVATVLVTAEVARRLFDARVALVAAGIMAFFPSLVFYTAGAHLETLFNFLIMASVLVIVAGRWPRGQVARARLLVFGAVLGLSALVRPFSLLALPLIVIVWRTAGAGWRRAAAQAAWATLAAAAVVSPWLVRNAVVMKSPVFSTGIGDALCDSRHPHAQGFFEVAAEYCLKGYDRLPYDRREVQRNKDNTSKAIRFVIHHPGDEARLWFWRGYYSYRDDHEALVGIDADPGHPLRDSEFKPVLATVADAYYDVVGALSLLGVAAFVGRQHPRRLFFLLLGAATALLPFILFGDPRYHVPVLPFLAVGAAATVSALQLGGRRKAFATTDVVHVRPQTFEVTTP